MSHAEFILEIMKHISYFPPCYNAEVFEILLHEKQGFKHLTQPNGWSLAMQGDKASAANILV